MPRIGVIANFIALPDFRLGMVSNHETEVDSGRALLSTGLAQDINALTDALGQTQTAEGSKEKLKEITDSITQRCSEAGVSFNQ